LALGLFSSRFASAQFERAPDPPPDEAPAARPKVTPPQLKHFEQATYPEAAQKAGLTADVVLRLTIDEQGNVTFAEVVEPAGNGFDEAAREAAMKFTFDPANRDGVAMKARILYRYSFTLAPVQTAKPDAAPPPPPTVGNLSGVLRIAGTESPLVGAEVVITTPKGEELRQRSDTSGRFSLEGVAPGSYRVKVSSPGFLTTETEETVVVGEVTEVTYRVATETEEGAIEVTIQGERPPREVTRRTIERREIERIPGTSGDALKSLESLPGVARPPGFAGILVVRGSYPEDTQVYVDGSNIPLVYHFGGLRSVLPTELLERIDFYPGNYGAKFGRGMGGIVDVGLKSPETRCKDEKGNLTEKRGCFNGIAQVDMIEGRMLLQGPLPVKGWSFAVGARRSWLDAWIGPVLESAGANIKSLPVYLDYQFIVEHKTSNDARTSLRFFGADDSFAAVIDPMAQEPAFGGKLSFGTSFYQAQLLHEQKLNSFTDLSTMVSVGKTSINFGIGSFKFDIISHPVHWRQELGFKLMKGVRVNTGLDFQVFPYDINVRSPAPPVPGQPESGPFSSRPILEVSESQTGLRQGWYADAELQPTDRLRIVPGIRVDYARDTGKVDASPRLNARYDLLPGGNGLDGKPRRRTTVKGGIGYYYQPPQFQESNAVYGATGLSSNRALHYSLGVEQEVTSQLDASVEGFYKDYDNLVAPGRAAELVRYTNHGFGKAYGLETLIRYKPDKHFFGWLAYTLSRSERQDFRGDERYLIPYDQTHNLTVLGSYRLGRGWEFGLRFRVVSGSLVTPVRGAPSLPAIYAANSGAYVPLEGKLYSERLPLFHQLDLRLDKRWQIKTYRISAYLDVYNVYNNPGIEGVAYDYNFARRIYQSGIPFLPSVGVRGEF
jgi:TonB family protein